MTTKQSAAVAVSAAPAPAAAAPEGSTKQSSQSQTAADDGASHDSSFTPLPAPDHEGEPEPDAPQEPLPDAGLASAAVERLRERLLALSQQRDEFRAAYEQVTINFNQVRRLFNCCEK